MKIKPFTTINKTSLNTRKLYTALRRKKKSWKIEKRANQV